MRKFISTAVIIAVLGIPNLALANLSDNHLKSKYKTNFRKPKQPQWGMDLLSHRYGSGPQYFRRSPVSNSIDSNILPSQTLAKQNAQGQTQSDLITSKMEKQIEEIYKSIAGKQPSGKASKAPKAPKAPKALQKVFFIKTPQSIYDYDINNDGAPTNYQDKQAEIAESVPDFFKKAKLSEEKFSGKSASFLRQAIDQRRQYAATIDKAVSLSVLKEAGDHSNKLSELLNEINQASDLKDIVEIQARIQAQLAMIQNETIKLQTIAHLRNAEQELIDRLQRQRSKLIFRSNNNDPSKKGKLKIPDIRYTIS
ncbi:type IV secretion system protein [Bartonella sp. B35(2025)]